MSAFAPKLQVWDEIRIIAPSTASQNNCLTKATELFESLWYKISFSQYFWDDPIDLWPIWFHSLSLEKRLSDFHNAFLDRNVKAIISYTWWFLCIELLRYIDRDIIRSNPKIFCWYSDITILLNSIFSKTWLVTYHSLNIKKYNIIDSDSLYYSLAFFKKFLVEQNESVTIVPPLYSMDLWTFRDVPSLQEDLYNWFIVVNEGRGMWIIVGGNICTFNLLQWTDFMPSLEWSLLFLEDDDLRWKYSIGEFNRNFESLSLQKWFDKIQWIVLGKFQKWSQITIPKITKLLQSKLYIKNIPIIVNVDFSHTIPACIIPIWSKCTIDTSKNTMIVIENV